MDEAGDFTEVTDFVENGKLFVGVQSPSPAWLVIDDWDTARRFAYDQEATGQEVWTDLRESVAAERYPANDSAPEELKARITKLRDDYRVVLLDHLGVTPSGASEVEKGGSLSTPGQ